MFDFSRLKRMVSNRLIPKCMVLACLGLGSPGVRAARALSVVLLAGLVAVGMGCGGSGSNGSGDRSAPSAPSNLSGTSGDGKVKLEWKRVVEAEAYNVYRATSSSSVMDSSLIMKEAPLTGAVSSTTYTDGSAQNGTRYYYVVTAIGAEGAESDPSEVLSRAPFSSPPDNRP